MNYFIRTYQKQDLPFLWDMLYHSIYLPEDEKPAKDELLKEPSIEKYLKDWGRATDHALIAADDWGKPLGAIWMRLFAQESAGYGFIDEETPEIGMALLPECRGKGMGGSLLRALCDLACSLNYKAVSLSVDPQNRQAVHLYEKTGFVKVKEDDGGSWVMRKQLLKD
ncbi:ribosomal protein S18 acetylase RimI-like enzyme [Pullulanibacillus pueri]|uniref:N-acetyltransferase domain-containing protein n=1 Tax=Pullulanibacillus pueri TaxID=1437324 RepID=A0A8J2ZTJ8_9BACL|nr:GNAT family N-acetyltransferase [Pullulanibacillus pueri]MBM7681159.1 ribosomal protein S18 acetylase RimI-like enzyme [Pullulanibacillus pueri]GGH77277.1 hypothetical protein GCM10007096_08940 [Pullulanibacillus pueri]